jgi:hypothetical protein
MKMKNLMFVLVGSLVILSSCNKSKNDAATAAEETNSNKTAPKVQKIIDDLGLVYVEEGANDIITYDEVKAAEQARCDALVKIGKIKEEAGDYKVYTNQVLSEAYNYDYGKVFFKPTLAFGDQTYRNDKKGALAYFVGGDKDYPNDKGFALTPWVKAGYDNAGKKIKAFKFMGL